MNNQPKIEAFKSFYQQGKDLFAAGDVSGARDAFLKAAELANDISVHSSSYDVRMEYHKTAAGILDFVKKSCVTPVPRTVQPTEEDDEEKPKPVAKSESGGITFADVAGMEDVKDQIRYKVLEPLKNPALLVVSPDRDIIVAGVVYHLRLNLLFVLGITSLLRLRKFGHSSRGKVSSVDKSKS